MALPHRSIAVETGVEFINLEPLDINPLMSACEIKVFYLGKNRNHSYITKEVATEMSKTLRGAPIVGYYKKDKGDFDDHGQQIIMDSEGIHFNTLTVPYGFVAPDSKVWFQDFEEEDEFGNQIIRTYLMTTGYIWTEQFEEAKKIFEDNGKPQSMEIDEKTVKGHWSEDLNNNIEFFIISDAIFSKLCILGDDVEPCFEGAAITDLDISKKFTLDDKFKNTLFSMMNDLKQVLKGDTDMQDINVTEATQTVEEQEPIVQFEDGSEGNSGDSSSSETGNSTESGSSTEGNTSGSTEGNTGGTEGNTSGGTEGTDLPTGGSSTEGGSSAEGGNTSGTGTEGGSGTGNTPTGGTDDSGDDDDDDDEVANDNGGKDKKNYSLEEYEQLQANYNQLQTEFTELKATLESLSQFKDSIVDKQKDALIEKFYMLSDEDKKDVIENKSKYTLEEIESKLAVIGFHKGVNFSYMESNDNNSEKEDISTTYILESETSSIPDWVKAVKENEQ